MIIHYNQRAVRDLEAIADHIRLHNPAASGRVRERIEQLIKGLADFPYQGSPTDEPDIRRLVANPFPYLIFYRIKDEAIIILHIGMVDAERTLPDQVELPVVTGPAAP